MPGRKIMSREDGCFLAVESKGPGRITTKQSFFTNKFYTELMYPDYSLCALEAEPFIVE